MPAVARLDRCADVAHLGQCERGIFELLDHLAGTELGQLAALGVGALVLAVLQRGIVVGHGAIEDLAVDLAHALLGHGLLVGRIGIGAAQHDVRHLHLAACRALTGHLQDVVTELGAHRLAHFAHGGRVRRVLEGVHHLQGAEPTQIATVLLRAGIIAAAGCFRNAGEVLPFHHATANGNNAVPCHQGVFRRSLWCHLYKDVARAYFLLTAIIGLAHQLIVQLPIDQVWARQLLAVTIQFLAEFADGVHAQLLRFAHLQLVVDEELEVLVQGGVRNGRLLVVLLVDRLELATGHGLSVHGHEHGIGTTLRGGVEHAHGKERGAQELHRRH